MSEIIIRTALDGDLDDVAAVELATSDTAWSRAALERDIRENRNAIVLVVEDSGRAVGYADVWCIAGEAELNNIAVLEEYRGRHLGQRLLEEIMKQSAESCILMNLEVRAGNERALGLYRKMGFKENGLRRGYYENNGEDAVLMTAEIK